MQTEPKLMTEAEIDAETFRLERRAHALRELKAARAGLKDNAERAAERRKAFEQHIEAQLEILAATEPQPAKGRAAA